MKTRFATLAMVIASCFNTQAQELPTLPGMSDPDGCIVPQHNFGDIKLMGKEQVKVEADKAQISSDKVAIFTGNVDITSDKAKINADKAKVSQDGKNLFAEGQVRYVDQQLAVSSDAVTLDAETEAFELTNSQYQLTGFIGQGAAENIQVTKSDGMSLNQVSFTTCPVDDPDWQIRASEISIEKDALWGTATNTRFYVKGVPVFYLPYFAFPVSNQRQTGLLFPEISSSSPTGLDYEQPFYWNMAPNYDWTISPRIMTNRGLQLNNEFRYLTDKNQGQINFDYLANDSETNDNRYFYRFYHQGQINDNWTIYADFNGLSDDNYIVDLGSDFYNRADSHIFRTVGVNYYSENLTYTAHIRDFVFIGENADTYRALPEMQLEWTSPITNWLEFSVDSELAYFDNQRDLPRATRFHLAPMLTVPLRENWGELTTEVGVLNTWYHQDNIENTQYKEEVTRTLGQARVFGALYFERDQSWFGELTTMTLEPKFQYLYTSYEDQTDIATYDSSPLLLDVNGLFRGRTFIGLDRISDNNQVTLGLTSRIVDSKNREKFVASIGQIFYLEDRRLLDDETQGNRSVLAAEVDWRFTDDWYVRSELQVATDTDKVQRSSVHLEYRQDENSLVQLTHRYVRNLSGEQIDQIGLSASWPIDENWQWVARNYRDLERSRSIETYFGLQYESCCWALRLVAQRHLTNRFNDNGNQSTNEYDSGVSLQFIFKGMATTSSRRSMLQDGMFGYRRPYNLN